MEINLIWAQDKNGGIGKNNTLPWHIPEDLKNFKKLTIDSPIIMGRKTWESLTIKPLPNRRNIVLSSSIIKNVEHYDTIEKCMEKLRNDGIKKIFIIGGAQIYDIFFQYADKLHITLINENIDGIDIWFPISMSKIKHSFEIKEEINLTKIATYTKWIKKKIL